MKAAVPGLLLSLVLLLAACLPRQEVAPRERVWEGEILVEGVEEVPPGETLRIRPGTKVRFVFSDRDGDGWGDAGILVRGKIVAEGTGEDPIVFEPDRRDTLPGRWDEIRVESASPSRFVSCRFRGGRWALHAHFTPLLVESSRFSGNFGAVKFRGGPVKLYGNTFAGNSTAIRYWESDPEIISNIIRDSGTGVFCRQGSQKSLLRGNNFLRSSNYHVKLGELQEGDVDARFNYWGSSVVAEIESAIFDRKDVSYLGRVQFDPPEPAPFPLEETREGAARPGLGPGKGGETDVGR